MKSLLNGIILLFVVFHATKACGNPNEVHERLKELKRDAESDEWRNLVRKSYVAATKEFSNEFIVDDSGWEAGKGVVFFASNDFGQFVMKYDADGRLVKTGARSSFPELTRFDARREELLKQFRKEYAKSLGMTVEEVESNRRRRQSRYPGISEKRFKEQRMRIQPLIEEFVGYKFGRAPVENVSVKTNKCSRGIEVLQDLKLKDPYRHMKDITLTFRDNKLIKTKMYVRFGDEVSEESVVNEYNEIWKDIEKMLGVRHSSGGFSGGITGRMFSGQSYTYGGFKIHAGFDKGYIDIEIVDEEICEEIDAALRKRGRALPKLP